MNAKLYKRRACLYRSPFDTLYYAVRIYYCITVAQYNRPGTGPGPHKSRTLYYPSRRAFPSSWHQRRSLRRIRRLRRFLHRISSIISTLSFAGLVILIRNVTRPSAIHPSVRLIIYTHARRRIIIITAIRITIISFIHIYIHIYVFTSEFQCGPNGVFCHCCATTASSSNDAKCDRIE